MNPGDIPLGGEDAAWLHMEDAANPMVVSGLLELGDVVPVDAVARRLEDRLLKDVRFRARIVEPQAGAGLPRWTPDPAFHIQRHVEHAAVASADELRDFVSGAVSTLLDRTRPLWRVWVIDRPHAGTTILYRIHHAIADGFGLLALLLSTCDDDAQPPGPTPKAQQRATWRGYAAAAVHLLTLPRDARSVLKGPLGPEKRVAWTVPMPLDRVKTLARRLDGTVNDVLVAVVAGALRRYLVRRGDVPPGLRAMVPVNLRPRNAPVDLAAGNHFGLVVLDLPVALASARSRVDAVKQRMGKLKAMHEAVVAHVVLRVMGWAPRWVEGAGVAFFARKSSIVLTNVPGPAASLRLLGASVDRILFWVPQSGRMGLGISIFSYAGQVTVGVMADVGLLPDPERLAADVEAELEAMLLKM